MHVENQQGPFALASAKPIFERLRYGGAGNNPNLFI